MKKISILLLLGTLLVVAGCAQGLGHRRGRAAQETFETLPEETQKDTTQQETSTAETSQTKSTKTAPAGFMYGGMSSEAKAIEDSLYGN